jgi:hypothetical protein
MRPTAYVLKQRGLREYTQVFYTRREAVEAAKDCLWYSRQVTVTPLYAGQPIKWISQSSAARRSPRG